MLNIPVKNPLAIQLITIGAGVAAVLVAHFAPAYSVLLSQILQVLGIGAIGTGVAQITQKDAKPGDSMPVEAVPTSVRPPGGMDAELRAWRHPAWRFGLLAPAAFGVAALFIIACDPRKPPCDETKLRAVDARYLARVTKLCLAKYDRASDCPEFPALQADHRRELREECPQ